MTQFIGTQLIGILGGTFNPIHIGHLRLGEVIAESLQLDQVLLVPAANPPHKPPPAVSAAHRLAMAQLAVQGNPLFAVDDIELKRAGASYTFDTLTQLKQKWGESAHLVLIMGSDAFAKFDTWHRWQEILTLCHIALVARADTPNFKHGGLNPTLTQLLETHYTEQAQDLHEKPCGCITMQAMPPLPISSTQIRTQLQQHHSVRYLLPDCVIAYITQNKLYTR